MKPAFRILYCVMFVSACSTYAIQNMNSNSARTALQLSQIEQHIKHLYSALDPFANHADEPVYAFFKQLRQQSPRLYSMLQDAYHVIAKHENKKGALDQMPLFKVLADDRVQNALMYGSDNQQLEQEKRDRAQQRFMTMVNLVNTAPQSEVISLDDLFRQSEYHNAEAAVGFLLGEEYPWWQDSLDDFKQKAQGAYVDEVAQVIQKTLRDIEAYEVPATFALYAMPQFLSQLAQEDQEDIRYALAEEGQAKEDLKSVLQEQIQEEEQKLQEQKVSKKPPKQPAIPDRGELMEQIRKGAQLRKTEEKLWWKEQLDTFAQALHDEESDAEINQLTDAIDDMLHRVNAQKATRWFQDDVFEQFLKLLENHDDIRMAIREKDDVQQGVTEFLSNLVSYDGTSASTSAQDVAYRSLSTRGAFTNAFDVEESDSDESDSDED